MSPCFSISIPPYQVRATQLGPADEKGVGLGGRQGHPILGPNAGADAHRVTSRFAEGLLLPELASGRRGVEPPPFALERRRDRDRDLRGRPFHAPQRHDGAVEQNHYLAAGRDVLAFRRNARDLEILTGCVKHGRK